MGMSGARRLQPMLANLRNILAIELLAACQGIDLLEPLRTAPDAQKAHDIVRSVSPIVTADRSLSPDIEAVARHIAKGSFADVLQQIAT
jgi:histidine ammonia-lyase